MSSFWADKNISLEDHIIETYFFETLIDPKVAAESLCQEQSTLQWRRQGFEEDFRPKHGAKIIDLKVLQDRSEIAGKGIDPSQKGLAWCEVKIAHPHINFGPRIPNILSAAAGEGAFYSRGITTIKLTDLEFPKYFLEQFQGPKFGVDGLRKSLNVKNRPIFFGVVRPDVGISPSDFSGLAYEAWCGGIDVACDSEMLSDLSWSPLDKRCRACRAELKKAELETGEKKLFLANITDEVDRLLHLHDSAVREGAGMVMVNAMAVGLSAVRMLRKHAAVPVVAHFDSVAPMSRLPFHGISGELLIKLQRIVGCDVIMMPGFGERMKTTDADVVQSVKMCTNDLGNIKPALPAPSGFDWAGTMAYAHDRIKSLDFGFVSSVGIFGHPMGPRGGAKSLRQAWDAVSRDVKVEDWAKDHIELAEALRSFAPKNK